MSDIQFVEVDAAKINNEIISSFEKELGTTLYPGDERRIFLNQAGQTIVGLKNYINETAKQNLLRYASGDVLDAIGERTDTGRNPAQRAKTTVRFILSAAQTGDITVPKGTRVTPDGKLYFATTSVLLIKSGELYGDVEAESTEGGEKYNNFAPGQIKTIVDPIPFVASAANTDTSSHGSDVESDDSFRERIREAPSMFSTAGTADGYIYWAKTADVDIEDVSVTAPGAGEVKIIVLMKNGELPSQAVLDAVAASCSDKRRRPLTDHVTVSAPSVVNYNIELKYYISKVMASEEVNIKNAVNEAVDQYNRWQSEKLGREINPDYLRQLMLNAGSYKIELKAPEYTTLTNDEVAKVGTVKIDYKGLI